LGIGFDPVPGADARLRECLLGESSVKRRWSGISRNVSILLVGLTLGLLLSLAWWPAARTSAGPSGEQSTKVLLSIQRLEAEQQELKAVLADLRQELTDRQRAAAAQTNRLQVLRDELDRQRLLAGLVPVQGLGVLVTLDDSAVEIPLDADPNAYIIHEYDLRDIVNLLWMAGSEAIAINDERLVSTSSVYCVGSTVMVNNTRLSPPYLIRAIGNPRVQQDYLRNPSYLKGLREKQRLYGLRFEVESATALRLAAYNGGFLIQQARPGD
jgi:uncharacterized protein YlxW (UPF0749 family)